MAYVPMLTLYGQCTVIFSMKLIALLALLAENSAPSGSVDVCTIGMTVLKPPYQIGVSTRHLIQGA
jgi:hypothetical protein